MASNVAHQHLAQLTAEDKNDQEYATFIYQQAMSDFKDFFMYFFNNYATDGVLGLGDMRRNVSQNDYRLWRKVLAKYSKKLESSDEGKDRLDRAKHAAGYDRINLLSSIAGIAVGYASAMANDYFNRMLVNEYKGSIAFQTRMIRYQVKGKYHAAIPEPDVKLKGKYQVPQPRPISDHEVHNRAMQILNQKSYGFTVSERIWNRNDALTDEIKHAVSTALTRGTDQAYMDDRLFKFIKQNKDSVATDFDSTERWLSDRLVLNEKNRVEHLAAMSVYKAHGVKWVNWVTQPKACRECRDLEAGNPYSIDKVPERPHISCRCILEPIMNN